MAPAVASVWEAGGCLGRSLRSGAFEDERRGWINVLGQIDTLGPSGESIDAIPKSAPYQTAAPYQREHSGTREYSFEQRAFSKNYGVA